MRYELTDFEQPASGRSVRTSHAACRGSTTDVSSTASSGYCGQAHHGPIFVTELLSDLKSGAMLLADRGYDADWIRAFADEHGVWANIPPKRNRKDPICFSPYLYRARSSVERFFNRIKQCRPLASRYDKLAANYLAFIKLAAIRIWLRAYESTP
jgi:transposase